MKGQVCASVVARNIAEIARAVKRAERLKADLLEIRLDYLKLGGDDVRAELERIRNLTGKPLIATNRPTWEGGLYRGELVSRLSALLSAAEAGFDYVDLELRTARERPKLVEDVRELGAKAIISSHDFRGFPPLPRLFSRLKAALGLGADLVKLIPAAKNYEDNLRILSFLLSASGKNNLVAFCMGPRGLPSRVLCTLFGSQFTYGSLERGKEAAPGQLTISEIRAAQRLLGLPP